jgi:hypothetical protein
VKAPSDDGLLSIHCRLDQTAPAISGTTLPTKLSMLFDRTKMAVALRRTGPTQNRCRSRRDDHARRGMSLQHLIINPVAIMGTSAATDPTGSSICSSKSGNPETSPTSSWVSSTATISCVSASTARCSLRQRRRDRTPASDRATLLRRRSSHSCCRSADEGVRLADPLRQNLQSATAPAERRVVGDRDRRMPNGRMRTSAARHRRSYATISGDFRSNAKERVQMGPREMPSRAFPI